MLRHRLAAARAVLTDVIRMPYPRANTSPAGDPERIGRVSARPVLSILGVLATAIFVLGCGLEGQPFDSTTRNGSDPIVSTEEIAAQEPGSPASTVLRWWRAVQTRNPDVVKQSYTPKARAELPKTLDFTVVAVLAPTASESSIITDSLEMNGKNKATLLATIDSPNVAMNGPLDLPMEKVGDEWLLADSSFLTSLSGAFAVEQALQDANASPSEEKEPSKAKEPSGG
jgi:hypothetical protein